MNHHGPVPGIVAHADWSTTDNKRWIAIARPSGGHFVVDRLERVGDVGTLLSRLAASAQGGTALIGFDFPLGVPLAYARRAGICSFREVLRRAGTEMWPKFFEPASRPDEISTQRPFYPARPGGSSHAHLISRLGVTSIGELLRLCERATDERNAACSLFWTLGANQVGRAAISGWRDVLCPAIKERADSFGLWPFDGELEHLLRTKQYVVVETYPAEAYSHLALSRPGIGWSKRNQVDRQREASKLNAWADHRNIRFAPDLDAAMASGFGASSHGEDCFDALVGLLSMLTVISGERPCYAPNDHTVRTTEGWIFGQLPQRQPGHAL